MSSRRQEGYSSRRTSERMRLKLLRNVDQFKILNPFRRHTDTLPDELHRQLRKIDYLSATSINTLRIGTDPKQEILLHRMAQAHQEQENKFQSIFGHSTDLAELEPEPCSHSEAPPTHPSHCHDHPEVKDELHMHIYDDRSHIHDNLFESRAFGLEESHQMEVEQPWQPPAVPQAIPPEPLQDFEQYFIS